MLAYGDPNSNYILAEHRYEKQEISNTIKLCYSKIPENHDMFGTPCSIINLTESAIIINAHLDIRWNSKFSD